MRHGEKSARNDDEPQQHHDEYNVGEAPSAPTLMLGEPTTTAVDHRERDVQIDIYMPARGG